MNGKPGEEQSRPFLDDGRPSEDDFELTEFDGERSEDLAPDTHYEEHPPPAQGKAHPLLVAGALLLTVLGFTVNTEATAYFENVLGWKKPFATLYLLHSSLALPWLCHISYLRWKNRHIDYRVWVRDYNNQLRDSISTIDAFTTDGPKLIWKAPGRVGGPMDFLATAMAIVTLVLTVSGVSWFVSLSLTTPGDLTAIYNCSTFFAAVFSIPLLKERLGWFTISAVVLSIIGTFIIAYGDTTAEHPIKSDDDAASKVGTSRLLGNIVACAGAVAFGLYEVLFKKWACSSRPMSPQATLPLTLAASALTGIYTFAILWVGLVLLHIFGIETFVMPSPQVILWIAISVLGGCVSITLIVVLVIWTGPIFGSFANVLSVFFVAIADWIFFGLNPSPATYGGGVLIVVGFGLLAWDTFKGDGKH
ncbi:hypothetical protein KC331_g4139 [Hortaea werneckii]|uniref:EamA domain-containing protein n=1 Tax=Hortaea werneckii TaxID=91943 RepID=A0A3M7CWN6_HORWE|nr:hypothetical protein KC331_g4139 [Hortaea werneckii]RMY51098.1 hypothetical protein D0865_06534 [Hortaea werneckii]RMY56117.1 hypothetical protein D0863_13085 [Hortaea werneckii]